MCTQNELEAFSNKYDLMENLLLEKNKSNLLNKEYNFLLAE